MNAPNVIDEAKSIKASLDQIIPPDIRRRMEGAGLMLTLGSTSVSPLHIVEGTVVAVDEDQLAEEELLEEMGSYEKKDTGIDNVIYLSPKGRTRHPARIKVAIDPWDSFDPRHGVTASIAVHDGKVTGAHVPPDLHEKLMTFIDLNRQTILDYWDYKISTSRMEELLKPLPASR